MRDAEVVALVSRQHGVISRQQAMGAGMSSRQIQHRVRTGEWIREYRGVYRHAAVPANWRGGLLAASFTTGGLASHRAAAALHGIDGYRPGHREIVLERGRRPPMTGLVVHESTQMDRACATILDHIPCTGLARTVLDLAAVVSERRLDRTIDAVLRDRMLEGWQLRDVLVRHSRRGRDGCGRLRRALDDRFGEGPVPLSDWSRMVADLLVDRGLPDPELEWRVHSPSGSFVAQVDLAYPAARVAIELDSVRWHLDRESFVEDRRRWNRVSTLGWTVLNFTWADYVDTPDVLCATVRRSLPPKLLP